MMPGEKKEEKKKCSYEYEEFDYKCNREALSGDEHCIFHSENIEGKNKKFSYAFWNEFERQKKSNKGYDFTGFVFPGDISFKGKEFKKVAYFLDAQFSGGAYFNHAQFSGWASFSEAQFSEVDFMDAQFSGRTDFNRAKFKEDASFENIKLEKYNSFEMIDI
jgi:uncharacterized protein YjbI with pentapeptide repeats